MPRQSRFKQKRRVTKKADAEPGCYGNRCLDRAVEASPRMGGMIDGTRQGRGFIETV